MNAIRRYAIPVIMTLVAINQMFHVHTNGLSSWRGGGFGMYARFHPRSNEVWIYRDGRPQERYQKYDDVEGFSGELNRCLTYVNTKTARELMLKLPRTLRAETLEVYRLDFDPISRRLSRKLLLRLHNEKD